MNILSARVIFCLWMKLLGGFLEEAFIVFRDSLKFSYSTRESFPIDITVKPLSATRYGPYAPSHSGDNYSFDFGPTDLLKMVGISAKEGEGYLQTLFKNKKLRIMDNKVFVTDVEEIVKQAEYYKKMQKIEKARRDGSRAR